MFDQLPAVLDVAGKIAIGVVDVFEGIAHGGVTLLKRSLWRTSDFFEFILTVFMLCITSVMDAIMPYL